MIRRLPLLSGPSNVPVFVNVSVPFVPCLLDGKRYMRPDQLPPPESRDLRAMKQDKPPRKPSLRVMVRYALKSQSAEEFGKRMRRRYAENAGRPSPTSRGEREIDAELDRLLGDPVE